MVWLTDTWSAAWFWGLFRHGHYAVAVFIVLSGFCLMLPVTRDPNGRLPGGFAAYLGRRARRILPPYYAALGMCWIAIALIPALRQPAHLHGHAAHVLRLVAGNKRTCEPVALGGPDVNFIGMDVVEVAPVYDTAEITALAAATIVWEYLALIALLQ